MPALEFCLPPAALPGFLRKPVFGRRKGRTTDLTVVWHDTAADDLMSEQLSLCETRSLWRLERLAPGGDRSWAFGAPPAAVAEAGTLEQLGLKVGPVVPVAGFRGQHRVIRPGSDPSVTLSILLGTLRGIAQERPVCRLVLEGPAPQLMALSTAWAADTPLAVPHGSLASEALSLARGTAVPPQLGGSPQLGPDMTVADGFALIVGHLAATILAGVDGAAAGHSAEPVHTVRVAVRRLRAAVSVFGRALNIPAVEALKTGLKQLAQTLGAARDWDVFLGGIAHDLAAALPEDARIHAIGTGALRKREAAYAALRRELGSAAFRQLTITLAQLAALRPWEAECDAERQAAMDAQIGVFAEDTLGRQFRRFLAAGTDVAALPAEALHDLRKQGKRLRYTADFVAPLYGRRRTARFLRRLADLQETLGHLNDGAAAAALMQDLGTGAGRQFAIGAVQGFVAARSGDSREAIATSWDRVQRAKPFWL